MHGLNKIHTNWCIKFNLRLYLSQSHSTFHIPMFLLLKQHGKAAPPTGNLPDEQLVNRYLETREKELIAVLFERYTHLVYGICLNYLQDSDQSKDAVMEIFESLFHKLAVHKVLNFRNWLYSVARNYCLMVLRKSGTINRAKDQLKVGVNENEMPDDMDEDDDLLFNSARIGLALEQLNHEQSACIRLMYIDDKSYRDISAITGYSLNDVKSHIQNGKRNLKNYLLKQHGNTNA
jgi:RNA polymerase sigma factor (sigma-70 family)